MKKQMSLILLIMLLFTGCGYSSDIDSQAFAVAIGIGVGEKMPLKTTFLFENPSAGSEDGPSNKSTEDNTDIITLEAPSIYSAVRRLNSVKSKKINLSHTKMVVFSDELAREGIGDIIAGMVSAREFRPNTFITVSRGSADSYLREVKPKQETFTDKYFDHMMQKVVTDSVNESYLYYLYFNTLSGEYGSIVPLVGVNDPKEDKDDGEKIYSDDYSIDDFAGDIVEESSNHAETSGSAVICNDKAVGYMGSIYTGISRMICGEYMSQSYSITDPLTSKLVTVRLIQSRDPKIKAAVNGAKASIGIDVGLNAEFVNPSDAFKTNKDAKRFLDYVCTCLENGAQRIIYDSQKKYGCDILGTGEKLKARFPDIKSWKKFDWKTNYKNADIKVNFYIDSSYFEEVE